MVRDIITSKEELEYRSKEFDIKDSMRLETLVTDLKDTLKAHPERFYLCGKEIGFEERIIAIRLSEDSNIITMINPAIKSANNMIIYREKDPLNQLEYFIPRFSELTLTFQEGDSKLVYGNIKSYKFSEGASIVLGQAFDLLNGLLPSDYGLEVIPEFDKASKEEQEEVLEAYINSLHDCYAKLDAELLSDEEYSKTWEQSKFISAVNTGQIEFKQPEVSNKKMRKLKRFLKSIGKKVSV